MKFFSDATKLDVTGRNQTPFTRHIKPVNLPTNLPAFPSPSEVPKVGHSQATARGGLRRQYKKHMAARGPVFFMKGGGEEVASAERGRGESSRTPWPLELE